MKKMIQMFLISCVLMLGMQSVFAAENVWVAENFALSSIHRLMIADPSYAQFKDGVTKDEIVAMLQEQGAPSMYVLKKSDVVGNILRDAGIDLNALDPLKAEETLTAHMPKYVDAYMVATVVHNRRVTIFYDVYSAQTKERIFSEQVLAGSSEPDTLETYKKVTERFYKDFQKEAKNQDKKNKK